MEVASTLRTESQTTSEITVDNSSEGFQCLKSALQNNVKHSLVNNCYGKHGWSYSKGREVERRETRGSQAKILLYLEIRTIWALRLTGIKGSDLISLLIRTLKGLMTICRCLLNFSLPTNRRGHHHDRCN